MEFDFQDWLYQCLKEDCLSKEEIDECIEDTIKAYQLFVEYIDSDRMDTGSYVQDELKRFKIRQSRSLSGWPKNK